MLVDWIFVCYWRKCEGFTLVELLVTMALMTLLSGVVVAAINPAKRIRDSKNIRAQGDVGVTAKVLESCLVYTNVLTGRQNAISDCDTQAKLMSGGFSRVVLSNGSPPNFQLNANASVVCISQQGESSSVNWKYYSAEQNGQTSGTVFSSATPCVGGL